MLIKGALNTVQISEGIIKRFMGIMDVLGYMNIITFVIYETVDTRCLYFRIVDIINRISISCFFYHFNH